MIYVCSDIHGCFSEFKCLLETVDFKDEDIIVTPAMKAGLQKNSRSQTLPLMRGQKLKEV
ncbi:MAG: hypothetical protein PUC86_05920 [Solobacterium sp.]|nr:hypothetical protein [Solobacterium sp.]